MKKLIAMSVCLFALSGFTPAYAEADPVPTECEQYVAPVKAQANLWYKKMMIANENLRNALREIGEVEDELALAKAEATSLTGRLTRAESAVSSLTAERNAAREEAEQSKRLTVRRLATIERLREKLRNK